MKNLAFLTNQLTNRNAKIGFTAVCLSLICFVLNSCGNSSQDLSSESLAKLNKTYPSQSGGTLLDASTAEPSGLIYMVAGESAAGAISSNIFNKLLKYDKNLDLEGEGFAVGPFKVGF